MKFRGSTHIDVVNSVKSTRFLYDALEQTKDNKSVL